MSYRSLGLLAVLAAVLCFGSTAVAETIVYQEGANDPFTDSPYAGTGDAFLLSIPGNAGQHWLRNYGGSETLNAGFTDFGGYIRSVIRFDLSSLAGEYASIDSVKLRLYVSASNVSVANNLQLFRFTAANGGWVEGNATGNASVNNGRENGAVCWNYRAYSSTAWDSESTSPPPLGVPGLGTAPADYVGGASGAIAATAYSSSTTTGWMELVFTDVSFIGDWAAGNNPGMALRAESEAAIAHLTFHSSEYAADASLRPQLVIDYTPIPEPSTLALLATGLIGLLCYAWRKRK